tara:strand:+ start:824 stop:1015 length:192 start_codon:yes stop_codon:yes gene_type:complete
MTRTDKLIDTMTWMIGYIPRLHEMLVDAIREGEQDYDLVHELASRHDEMFGTEHALALEEEFQ